MPSVSKGAAARTVALRRASSNAGEREAEASENRESLHSEHTHELAEVLDMEWAPSRTQKLAIEILMAPAFDYVLGIIIFANMFIMIIEIDQATKEENSASSGTSWTEVCGWLALAIFVVELMLRLFAFRCLFWKDAWNIFDFIVVVIDVVFSFVGLVVGNAFPVSILRIFRLAKLARVSKVLRIFPELRLLLAGLVGSVRAIFWGVVLLVFVLIVWSMIAVLFIHPLAKNMDCEQCPHAYDSVFHASITVWQQIIAGDSWGQVTIPVIKMHPITILFFIPLFMTVGMAVMNLILGVVVNVALNAKDKISEEDSVERQMLKMEQRTHLLDLCHKMDVHRTGLLSREQVFEKFNEPGEFQRSIRSMDVTDEDLHIIWTILDHDKNGSLPYKVLMNKLYSVRESDTEFMLAYIKYYITSIRTDLLQTMSRMEARMEREMQKVEVDLEEDIERQFELTPSRIEETQRHAMRADAYGVWQVLDESKQKLHGAQDTSKTNSGDCSSLSKALISTSVNDEKSDWDKKLILDMNTLREELQNMSVYMNQKLESQVSLVSLMSQTVCMASSEAIAQGPCFASI